MGFEVAERVTLLSAFIATTKFDMVISISLVIFVVIFSGPLCYRDLFERHKCLSTIAREYSSNRTIRRVDLSEERDATVFEVTLNVELIAETKKMICISNLQTMLERRSKQ